MLTGETDGYYRDFGSLASLAKALRQAWVYDGVYSPHRDRVHGRPPTGLHGRQFVVSAQNHDQVGNRARGDRLGHLVSPGRVRVAAALLLTSPFVPMLFQGEEWAASTPFLYFTDHEDADLGRAVSEGRRREFSYFGWAPEDVPDPQDPPRTPPRCCGGTRSTRATTGRVLAWYRALIALRRSTPGLATGPLDDVAVTFDEHERWLVARRTAAGIEVAVNLGDGPAGVPVAGSEVVLSWPERVGVESGAVRLPPDGVAVVSGSAPSGMG